MKMMTFLQAIRQAQYEEMQRDPNVIIMGEDVRADILGTSAGFLDEFGPERVRNVPLSEAGFVGAAVGAALTGLRPIVDMMLSSFMYCAMDQFVSQAAKSRYMFGGQADIPVLYRAGMFYGGAEAAHHSDRPYSTFMTVPGLKIIVPSSPVDAKGLIKSAVRCNDPVLCFEDGSLWPTKGPVAVEGEALPTGEVPDDPDLLIPLGVADVKSPGDDVTVIAIAGSVPRAVEAAKIVAEEDGVSVEVIDPRTLVPMDWETILGSAARTGRVVVVDPAHRTCSAASEIAATIVEEVFDSLRAPVKRVVTPDVHIPFSPELEKYMYPTTETIVAAIRAVTGTTAGVQA
jgi:acetoin:2,6-dichlorophenolindophenol oxidoreductase subunit beta